MTAALTPDFALAYIRELSADYLAGVVLDARGACLAGEAALAPLAEDVWRDGQAAGDGAAGAPASASAEGATSRRRVFAARGARHTIVVVTTRDALPGPTRRDVRTALYALGGESAQETPSTPIEEALVNALSALARDTFRRHSVVSRSE